MELISISKIIDCKFIRYSFSEIINSIKKNIQKILKKIKKKILEKKMKEKK